MARLHPGAIVLAMIVLVAAIAGCGGQAAPKLVDSCTLLTKADVEKLFGLPVAAPDHRETGDAPTAGSLAGYVSTCSYHTEGDSFKQASLLARQSFSPELAQEAMQGARKELTAAGNQIDDLANLGDVAYWDTTLNQLNMVKGPVWYIINVDAGDNTSAQQNAQTVAAAILSRP